MLGTGGGRQGSFQRELPGKMPGEGRGRWGRDVWDKSPGGGVGWSQTEGGEGGRGREFQAEEGDPCLKARRVGGEVWGTVTSS